MIASDRRALSGAIFLAEDIGEALSHLEAKANEMDPMAKDVLLNDVLVMIQNVKVIAQALKVTDIETTTIDTLVAQMMFTPPPPGEES